MRSGVKPIGGLEYSMLRSEIPEDHAASGVLVVAEGIVLCGARIEVVAPLGSPKKDDAGAQVRIKTEPGWAVMQLSVPPLQLLMTGEAFLVCVPYSVVAGIQGALEHLHNDAQVQLDKRSERHAGALDAVRAMMEATVTHHGSEQPNQR
jgi:hypothetical protein